MQAEHRSYLPNLTAFGYCITLALCIIGGRLAYLQIYLAKQLTMLSQKNYLRTEHIYSPRGNILDIHGKHLATNRPVISLYWQGTGNKKLTDSQEQIILALQDLQAQSFDSDIMNGIRQAERHKRQSLITNDISFDHLLSLEERFAHHPNIHISTTFKRYYPHGTLACHILGYLGALPNETTGKMGLEKIFDETLKGTEGEILRTINSFGTRMNELPVKKSLPGDDITTTIDCVLQQYAEEIFANNLRGTFLLFDPVTGELPVLLSRPAFDPSLFLDPVTQSTWSSLQKNHALLNRAFTATYPPASIFKLVSISAALEQGIVRQENNWNCCGYTTFGGRRYYCARKTGHGPLTTLEAVAHSCNIPFYAIGARLSIDTLATYARYFGLGSKTQDVFSEIPGLIPTREWKRSVKREPWWPGETLSAAIGQSYLGVTPIQIARMIGSIFTGYLVKPRLIAQDPHYETALPIKRETLDFLRRSMKRVVDGGTGQRVQSRESRDITIYAKTGTAQTSDLSKRDLGEHYLEHAWFVCYFYYKETRPLVMVILLENAGSSRPAVALAKQFLRMYHQHMSQPKEPDYNVTTTQSYQEPVIATAQEAIDVDAELPVDTQEVLVV